MAISYKIEYIFLITKIFASRFSPHQYYNYKYLHVIICRMFSPKLKSSQISYREINS